MDSSHVIPSKIIKNKLYQKNQEFISYGTYKIDTLTEIKDAVMNLNKRTTVVDSKPLNSTLWYDIGQVWNCKHSVNYIG